MRIYLAGASTTNDDVFKWMDELEDENPDIEFGNSYQEDLSYEEVRDNPSSAVEPAKREIPHYDGLLASWEDDIQPAGTGMEIMHAAECGLPVVVWYDGQKELLPWIDYHAYGRWDSLEQCFTVLKALCGDNSDIGE